MSGITGRGKPGIYRMRNTRFEELCQAKDYGVSDVLEKSKLSVTTINRALKGVQMSEVVAEAICGVFGCSVKELFARCRSNKNTQATLAKSKIGKRGRPAKSVTGVVRQARRKVATEIHSDGKIEDYVLLAEKCNTALNKAIKKAIAQGYQPYGKPFASFEGHYCQAIAKVS